MCLPDPTSVLNVFRSGHTVGRVVCQSIQVCQVVTQVLQQPHRLHFLYRIIIIDASQVRYHALGALNGDCDLAIRDGRRLRSAERTGRRSVWPAYEVLWHMRCSRNHA